jgi:hypothetical protein
VRQLAGIGRRFNESRGWIFFGAATLLLNCKHFTLGQFVKAPLLIGRQTKLELVRVAATPEQFVLLFLVGSEMLREDVGRLQVIDEGDGAVNVHVVDCW